MPSGKLDIIVTSTPLDLFPRVAPFKQNKHIYPPPRTRISEFTLFSLSLSLCPCPTSNPPTTLIAQITLLLPPSSPHPNKSIRATDRLFPFLRRFPSNQPTADTLTGPWIDIEPNNPPRSSSSFFLFVHYSKERKESLVTLVIEVSRWKGKEEGRVSGSFKGSGKKDSRIINWG